MKKLSKKFNKYLPTVFIVGGILFLLIYFKYYFFNTDEYEVSEISIESKTGSIDNGGIEKKKSVCEKAKEYYKNGLMSGKDMDIICENELGNMTFEENMEYFDKTYGKNDKKKGDLEASYKLHKNFIRHVCKEGVKILDKGAGNFEGPSYAGEYLGELIIKGSSDLGNFRCVFEPKDNEWGMNLKNATWER